jgi:UDP-2-acetamido-2-deoxy-ribo-hexuluronate aminotransferase
MRAHLQSTGIETLIHYPIPIPRQSALAPERPADCPIAQQVCDEIFSLPLYPALNESAVVDVAAAIATGPRTPR